MGRGWLLACEMVLGPTTPLGEDSNRLLIAGHLKAWDLVFPPPHIPPPPGSLSRWTHSQDMDLPLFPDYSAILCLGFLPFHPIWKLPEGRALVSTSLSTPVPTVQRCLWPARRVLALMSLTVPSTARTGPKPAVCSALINSQSHFPLVLSSPPHLTLCDQH